MPDRDDFADGVADVELVLGSARDVEDDAMELDGAVDDRVGVGADGDGLGEYDRTGATGWGDPVPPVAWLDGRTRK